MEHTSKSSALVPFEVHGQAVYPVNAESKLRLMLSKTQTYVRDDHKKLKQQHLEGFHQQNVEVSYQPLFLPNANIALAVVN